MFGRILRSFQTVRRIRKVDTDLVLAIYDATLHPERWPDLLQSFAESVDARGAFVFDVEGEGPDQVLNATYFSAGYDAQLVQRYLHEHRAMELEDQAKFARHARSLDDIELVKDDVLAPTREALMQRANARAMRDYGIFHRMGGLLNKDLVSSDRFALQFSERAGPPMGERLARINRMLPHIAKALNIGRHTSRIEARAETLAASYDMLRVGIAILDRHHEVILSNQEFQRQAAVCGAFRIGKDGRLSTHGESTGQALDDLLTRIEAHGRFGARPRKEAVVHTLSHHEHALCIEVCPIAAPDLLNGERLDGYAVFSLDTSIGINVDTANMSRFFELTKSESEVLKLLVQGITNGEISERRNRSRETINSQVKSVLMKTMSSNRTQLVRLALQYTPSLAVLQDGKGEANRFTQTGDEEAVGTA